MCLEGLEIPNSRVSKVNELQVDFYFLNIKSVKEKKEMFLKS